MSANFMTATALEVASLSAVFHEVMQTALAASLQAKIRNLNNPDGLKVLQGLYHVQDHFVDVVTPMAAGVAARATTTSLMARMRELLDGAPGTPGLHPAAFVNADLATAITAQQEINRELGSRAQILPHGRLEVRFVGAPPPGTVITSPGSFRYQFTVTYVRTIPGPAQEEEFDVLPAMDPPGWSAALVGNPTNRITLHTEEETAVQVDVVIPGPPPPVNSAILRLQIRSRHNPTEMDTTNSEVAPTVGAVSPQPRVVHVDLISPPINVATQTIDVGRGGPTGLPGKGRLLRFRFTFDEVVGGAVPFTVSFTSAPPLTFEAIASSPVSLGGTEPGSKESNFTVQATAPSVNGTVGTLTARIQRDSDAAVFDQQVINLRVQKS
jgi:hypothetical protein